MDRMPEFESAGGGDGSSIARSLPWEDSSQSAAGASAAPGLSGRSDDFGLTIDDALELVAGTDLGGVTIVRLVGEGGMGRVYEARQAKPDRAVAVKVLRAAIVSREQLRRFEYEAEVLGRLTHPNIALIHTTGVHRYGSVLVPYIVMELIADARSITQFSMEKHLGMSDRVAMMRRVCAAVAHGHQKGVIHRDLKPGNILVDAAGDPKVIDFGVARPVAARSSVCTQAGQLVGTLLYMSPEQRAGRGDEVDARTDVYALGLVLRELVTGRQPCGAHGGDREVAEEVAGAARASGCSRLSARGLGAIVDTCLRSRPAERYATAVELAADLGRWMAGEPILARPPTLGESIERFVRRHRATTAATLVVGLSLAAAIVGVATSSLAAARKAAEARTELYHATVLLAAEARDHDNVPEARRRLAVAEKIADDAGYGRPIELRSLAASLDDAVAVVRGHAAEVLATAWSPDGRRIASGARDGTAWIVDAPERGGSGDGRVELAGHGADVWRIAWSPDGAQVATASADKTVRVWDATTGRELRRIEGHHARMYGVAFSHDGTVVATSGADRTARLWDAATGAEVRVLAGHDKTVFSIALSRDGRTALTASQDGTARLWDTNTGEVLRTFTGHGDWVFDAVFAPDEKRLATASQDGTVRVWSVTTGRCTATLEHPLRVNAVAFTPDGRHVATGSHDGVLRLFSISRGGDVRCLRGHDAAIWTVACSPGGEGIATGAGDHTVRVWRADGALEPVVRPAAEVRAVAWSPDGTTLAVGTADAIIGVYDADTLGLRVRMPRATDAVNDLVFLAGADRLAIACDDGSVEIVDLDGRPRGAPMPCHRRSVHAVAVSPDGEHLATASEDGTVAIRPLESPDTATLVIRHGRRATCVRFSPDGGRIYTSGDEHRASAWDSSTGRRLRDFVGHDGTVKWLAVSPDGERLATASVDGTAALWRTSDAGLVHRLAGTGCALSKVAFSPDGSRVAAVSADGATHLWDTSSGRPLPILRRHRDEALAVAFSPDGRVLATGGADETVGFEGRSPGDLVRRRLNLSPSPR